MYKVDLTDVTLINVRQSLRRMSSTRNVQPEIETFMDNIMDVKMDNRGLINNNATRKLKTMVGLRQRRASDNFVVYELAKKGWLFTVFKAGKNKFGYTVQDNGNMIYMVNSKSTFEDVAKAIRFYGVPTHLVEG